MDFCTLSIGLPRWLFMWLIAIAIYFACKLLTWRSAKAWDASWQSQAAYLLAWPGMDAPAFLRDPLRPPSSPSRGEIAFALAKTALGATLFWGVVRLLPPDESYLRAWVGMAGLVFMLHFGTFHLLSCLWRRLGINARPIMNWPVLAHSVSDFWGRRWNLAFRDLTHRYLFQPLSRKFGGRAAILLGFGASGVIHDLVISVPAGGGYGLPTLYFLGHGLALLAERSPLGRAMGLGRGLSGRLFAVIIVAAPAIMLFHPPFLRNVVAPFMEAVGAG